ncbi:response regulator [Microcoleus sp. FACHB-672]|uniref:hybrid sensor histidine kinase/response regulator n=1 Tax=Microcoleus sp. FACHB-672 TaxID=2692825 RepID=UPI001689CC4D|nr:response regulator [Microcoleus sp. FACHB-672]MBD2040937.1 response regulator [Microcoleus sp. FACHB-672]
MPIKILFVDDEPDLELLISQKFKKKVHLGELQLVFARNGAEALEKLQEHPDTDMVLTDINMPVMDGLALLAKLNDINPTIKTVVMSAYGDMKNIRKAMNCGAFDFLTKPIDFQDLELTINKTWQCVQEIKQNLRVQQEQQEKLQQSEACAREQATNLEKALQDLRRTQGQLIQTEKMSLLGQLVAGVAHEINNPVNFIYGNLAHVSETAQNLLGLIELYQQCYPSPTPEIQNETEEIDLDFLSEDLPKMLSSMQVGAERIRQIVLTLRNFSRVDEAEKKPVNIHEGIDSTLMILQNRLKANAEQAAIEVVKEYGDLPKVECYAGQLNQVFMNIIGNAIDALNQSNKSRAPTEIKNCPSTITISTQVINSDSVRVSIKDNGPGMPARVKERLFDPFFTTKPSGEGTGLGLSISYQIVVDKHYGQLQCFSEIGQGAEFVIEIPIKQSCEMRMQVSSAPAEMTDEQRHGMLVD